jgi:hypothetical protein
MCQFSNFNVFSDKSNAFPSINRYLLFYLKQTLKRPPAQLKERNSLFYFQN